MDYLFISKEFKTKLVVVGGASIHRQKHSERLKAPFLQIAVRYTSKSPLVFN